MEVPRRLWHGNVLGLGPPRPKIQPLDPKWAMEGAQPGSSQKWSLGTPFVVPSSLDPVGLGGGEMGSNSWVFGGASIVCGSNSVADWR